MRKLLYIFIFLFLSFSFDTDSPPPSGWYQQFLPNIGSRQISDMFFLDSLTGWSVTPYVTQNDTAFVLKTTNGGDNWIIANIRTGQYVGYNKVYFLNSLTGFVCGVSQFSGFKGLSKSIDGGLSWISLNVPDPFMLYDDMSVLNEDIIWLVASSIFTGGIFRTTNGCLNWTQQFSAGGSGNPNKIYMVNKDSGFAADGTRFRRTTNSGLNWTLISGQDGFSDMKFIDNSTGWKCLGNIKKTTDGGNTWVQQSLPPSGGTPPSIMFSSISKLAVINKDTLWGVGGVYNFPSGSREMIWKTTNGGENWGFQIPDTSINLWRYYHIDFTDKNRGWTYAVNSGVHTVTGGGDTTFYVEMKPISTEIPGGYRLHQNYPNPFNYSTRIKFDISKTSYVTLKVYNLLGKEIDEIVNNKISAGSYDFKFVGSELPSGVYFYRLSADGNVVETRKMALVK